MPTWKCPLCGNAYESVGEQRPILCTACESWIYDNEAREPVGAISQVRSREATSVDDEYAEYRVERDRQRHPYQPFGPNARVKGLAILALLSAIALGSIAAARLIPSSDPHALVAGVLIDTTFGKDDPKEHTFITGGPWSLEWSMTTTEPVCLSSVQVWDGRGDRVGVASSRSGRAVFSTVGEHRMVVHASNNDRIRVLVRER